MESNRFFNGRPLSLPSSLMSTSPTSPVPTSCCRCSRRSKSTTSIFQKHDHFRTSVPRKGQREFARLPKLTWSVFKSKERSESKPKALSGIELAANSPLIKGRYVDSKSTSWTFVKGSKGHPMSVKSKKIVEIMPIYQTPYDVGIQCAKPRKVEKQAFSMTPTTKHIPRMNGNQQPQDAGAIDRNISEPTSLRQLLLSKNVDIHTKKTHSKSIDVPRSPGPLDGSLYAQIKKKRRSGKDTTLASLSDNRGYHSADELSTTSISLPVTQQQHKEDETGKRDEVKVSDGDVPREEQTSDANPVTSSRIDVDFLRDVTNTSLPSVTDVSIESGYQTIMSTECENFPPEKTESSSEEAPAIDPERKESSSSSLEHREELADEPACAETVEQEKEEVEYFNDSRSDSTSSLTSGSSEDGRGEGDEEPANKHENEETDTCTDDVVTSIDESTMNESRLISSMNGDTDKLHPCAKSHLTQNEVDDVMALVNECLSDQELRSGSATPEYTELNISELQEMSTCPIADMESIQDNYVENDEPQFSPELPDYSLKEIHQQYGEKSPEYALPVRDVVLGTIPARTALLISAEKQFTQTDSYLSQESENLLDNAIAELVGDISPTSVSDANIFRESRSKTEMPPPDNQHAHHVGQHKSSLDSGHPLDSNTVQTSVEVLRKTTSCSDVDSGIDGSALTVSVTSETRPSPTQERSTIVTTAIVSSSRDFIPYADDKISDSFPNSSISSPTVFQAPNATGYNSGNVDIPVEPLFQHITVRNEYNDSAAQQTQTAQEDDLDVKSSHASMEEKNLMDEDEAERKMREEIENTQKRLLWLQEQQGKLKKQKEEKRHSFGYSTATLPTKLPGDNYANAISATLPRPPGHTTKSSQSGRSVHHGKHVPSLKEQEDMDELLRSFQQLDIPANHEGSSPRSTNETMMSTAFTVDPVTRQYPHYHDTSPGFKVPDSNSARRADVFTPAYAHPMHQPQHMGPHHYQIQQQKQEEQARQRQQELNKQRQMEYEQQCYLEEQRQMEIKLQEQKRQEERERQHKFQLEFEQKQMAQQQEKLMKLEQQRQQQQQAVHQRHQQQQQPVHQRHQHQQLQQQQQPVHQHQQQPVLTSITTRQSMPNHVPLKATKSTPVASMTLPSPRKSRESKADDLQTQLDELDSYILQLTQNFDIPVEAPATPSKSDVTVRRRRSFSIDIDRKMDPSVPLSPEDTTIPVGKPVSPPRPPSRTKSSFDSVSRRLSHGFELAQMMRQNSIERESRNSSKDDDVFSPQTPLPSYPPQTSHTRPPQQQVTGRSLSSSVSAAPKAANFEERLSPQLFLAMTVNPGGRPVEEIHSYKEDLEPVLAKDAVDSAPTATPGTPGFPVSPTTPYVNAISPNQAHLPAGMAKTPLSALGLKPNPHPEPAIDELPQKSEDQDRSRLNSAPKHPLGHVNGTTTVTSQQNIGNSYLSNTSSLTTLKDATFRTGPGTRLEDQNRAPYYMPEESHSNGTQENIHRTFAPASVHHAPPGYTDRQHFSSNGWSQQSPVAAQPHQIHNTNGDSPHEKDLKSPWVYNGGSSPLASTPSGKSTGPTFAYLSTSGGVSPSGSRSLTGSNDSLLSDGSSSSHHIQPHLAYQQQRYNSSHPSLPPKESSVRNSGSSIRSTSTGSGYLGGTSQTSPHSAGSPVSSTTGHYPFSQPANRRESQLSSYDKQGSHHLHHHLSSDDGGLSSPTSERTSSSSVSDIEKLAYEVSQSNLASGSPPKFIRDTTSYWYKPDITRDQALAMLRTRPPGSFVVRDSRCYPGAFGLALKVHQVPAAVLATAKPGTDMNNELVRHFLIEPSTRGVKLKGCVNEPVFGSLSALIYQHSITPLALPCKLTIPPDNQEIPQQLGSGRNSAELSNTASELLRQGAACNVLYLGSADTESLTGPEAVERAMRECMQNKGQAIKTSIVHFKVSPQGITLTDNARKIFFRRHYPTTTVTFCGMDPSAREPHNRRWDASNDRGPPNARVFGFVAKKPGSSVDNVCHLFAELDLDQPAPAIVNFVSKILIGGN